MVSRRQYEAVTRRIIEQLEQGTAPWRQPWGVNGLLPQNAVSKRPYRGLNVLILGTSGYDDPRWLTFKQANQLGGHIRKGEHSELISFWDFSRTVEDEDENGNVTERRVPLLKLYNVFNAQQTEGIDFPAIPGRGQGFDPIETAEQIIRGMPTAPRIVHDAEPRAFYSVARDYVHLPDRAAFDSAHSYYSTAFHELGHSTGHPDRLGRFDLTQPLAPFGSEDYSREELVAEFTAAFLCAESGIANQEQQNAAYIASWFRVLRNDPAMAVVGAGKAQAAADFILGRTQETAERMVA